MPEIAHQQHVLARPLISPLDVRVQSRWQEARDVVALELVSGSETLLPTFEAGSFIDVELPNGLIRPYSLTNSPCDRDRYVLSVLIEPMGTGGSRAIEKSVHAGDCLRVSTPRNAFPLHGGAIHSVLFAGGIGVAPLISMAERLWYTGASFELHYCFQTQARAAFLFRLNQAPYKSRVRFWSSGLGPINRLDIAAVLDRAPRLSHIYTCGPNRLMDAVWRTALHKGWSPERIHQESFARPAD